MTRPSFTRLAALAAMLCACGGAPLHYYQPDVETDLVKTEGPSTDCILSVETFVSDAAYDDQRIVYRESSHRFDYYHFHRWAALPGEVSSTVVRETLRHTGRFRAVVGGLDPRAGLVLGGRVVAFEEVDVSEDEWRAHVALELTLRNNLSGEILWSGLVEDTAPIEERAPVGVARAIGRVLTNLGTRLAERIGTPAVCTAISS